MSKLFLAFDIGESYIKIAKRDKGKIQVYARQMPENLVKDGVVSIPHLLVDYLKDLRKELRLPKCDCGLVVPDELTVCRTLTMPAMTESQLEVNLPFEFSDFVSGKPQRYVYDYAMQEMLYDEEGKPQEMVITGAVMSKEAVYNYIDIFREAGFHLRVLIPQEIAITNIMKDAIQHNRADAEKEYCLVNLGHRSTQVYVFKGKRLHVLRNIYRGGNTIDKAIAEHNNVDEFVARTYKNKNFNRILEESYCMDTYASIAVEVMKVINFYRYNNRDSKLEDIYFFGGGSNIPDLCDNIAEMNKLSEAQVSELLPDSVDKYVDYIGLYAIGVTMQ